MAKNGMHRERSPQHLCAMAAVGVWMSRPPPLRRRSLQPGQISCSNAKNLTSSSEGSGVKATE